MRAAVTPLEWTRTLGTLVEETVIHPKGYGYEIKLAPGAERLSQQVEQHDPDLARQIDEIVAEFGNCSAAELELKSTIHFVDREPRVECVTPQELAKKVQQIKPHFSLDMIHKRIGEMRSKGWLSGLVDE